MHFGAFAGTGTDDAASGSSLTGADVETIEAHVDRALMMRDPNVPPLLLEPEDNGAVAVAFTHLAGFAATWPAAQVDSASGLSRADLDCLLSLRGERPLWTRPSDGPPDIFDGAEEAPAAGSPQTAGG